MIWTIILLVILLPIGYWIEKTHDDDAKSIQDNEEIPPKDF